MMISMVCCDCVPKFVVTATPAKLPLFVVVGSHAEPLLVSVAGFLGVL